MESVRGLTGSDYAKYALLVMYAWDMCDANLDPASDALDIRIKADGWTVVGIITGADDIIASSPTGIRQSMIRPSGHDDRKRYGFLAKSDSSNLYVAAIRGTDGSEEWIDDFVFFAGQRPPLPGSVETGFADIYFSMQYRPLGGAASVKLSGGIAAAIGDADVLVLGHSLGATLATPLTYELADPDALGSAPVGAIFYASPKFGDHDFVDGFATRVSNYTVMNYEHDVVPHVPPFDVTHLDLYRTLPYCFTITDEMATAVINSSDKGCCHHIIDYIAMLSPTQYSRAKAAPGWTADDASCSQCVISLREQSSVTGSRT
jgi:triacylglycerol lipase